MITGFEINVKGCVLRILSSSTQRKDFCMGFAWLGVKAFSYNVTIFDDDGADHRIGRGVSYGLFGEVAAATHVEGIVACVL